VIGSIFFGGDFVAGFSALLAAWVARRIGLLNTMVFTHLISNGFLIAIALAPSP